MISREAVSLVECGWQNASILVVGDVMLDQYVWGEVERISPEAPVPVVRASFRNERPGGAANVAMNLAGLGACVTVVGLGGGDTEQERLESLLSEAGIEPRIVKTALPTTTKLRVLAEHQQIVRVDMESRAERSPQDYEALFTRGDQALQRADAVVLSDYAKGTLPEGICQDIVQAARRKKIPVLVDPKQHSFLRYRGASVICPNIKELATATGEPVSNVEAVLNAGQGLVTSLELECVVATLGEKGIAVLRPESRFHAPAKARQVFDVSGAGDTVAAVLALSLACGVRIEMAAELANAAAGVVVGKVGTVPIQRQELLGAITETANVQDDEKLLTLDRLLKRVATWRSCGQRIVFTNGCFDLLHIGHIRLLQEARKKGDRLIVGLNSDDSVRRLKGPARPIVFEKERGGVLAALSSVDAVVLFADHTPLRLIEAVRPDVLVKGGDYILDEVVGAAEVRAWGGRVELIPLVPGTSTTRLISKSAARTPTASAAEMALA